MLHLNNLSFIILNIPQRFAQLVECCKSVGGYGVVDSASTSQHEYPGGAVWVLSVLSYLRNPVRVLVSEFGNSEHLNMSVRNICLTHGMKVIQVIH